MEKFKRLYILFLFVIIIVGKIVMPTHANFSSDFTTDNDVVGLDLSFNIGISNIEEYQEIKVGANSHRAFNIEIINLYDDVIYYGVWYKTILPKDSDDIKVARVNSSEIPTFGEISSSSKKVVSLVIINNTDNAIKVAIGVGSSITSVNDIEYLGGKSLINSYANIPINENASTYIRELYHDDKNITSVNIAGDKDKPKIFLNSDTNILLDNNGVYRYYGTDPNNYVLFNNELWRIISVSKVFDDSSFKNGSYRLKLIRNDSFGSYVWDSSEDGTGFNEWSLSSIYDLLNNLYYNGLKGNCIIGPKNESTNCDFTKVGLIKESRDLIGEALFYLGGVDTNKINKMYASDYFNAERGNEVYSCDDDECLRNINYVSNVGLMYASDYLYSVSNISYNEVPFNYNHTIFSWLKLNVEDQEYTITPVSNAFDNVLIINNRFGNVTNFDFDSLNFKWVPNNVSNKMKIRPVVYLRDDVIIVDGVGTIDNPYTLK